MRLPRQLVHSIGRGITRLLGARRGIAVQLYIGLGATASLTVVASVVAWISFDEVREAQEVMNQGSVPDMAAAFGVAQRVGSLVDAAPRLTVAETAEEFAGLRDGVDDQRRIFEQSLEELASRLGESEGIRRVSVWGIEMSSNIAAIEESVAQLLSLVEERTALSGQIDQVDARLTSVLITAIDDQFFYAMTGYLNLGDPPFPRDLHFTEEEVDRYRRMAELREGAAVTSQLVAHATSISELAQLRTLTDRFEAAASRSRRSLSAIGNMKSGQEISLRLEELFELSTGEGGLLDIRQRELEIVDRLRDLLASNREIATDLVFEVEGLVTGLRSSTQTAARSSTDAIETATARLLGLNLFALVGAFLIGWLFVGRHLLRRLRKLSTTMLNLAHDNLEQKVEVEGSDEIADMAEALEVFRKHALEVQRLNLVEKLAEDLHGKNEELEGVLADLRTAQNQIVMREKLAALGELTAGVAHEIKNPLNFVKNFSEVSAELLEELQAALPKEQASMTDDQRAEVDDLCQYLTANLQRIQEHGERANRIVHDMLMMGRGTSEWQATKINSLVKEHANLAYHSARAAGVDFQLNIEEDYDDSIGEIQAVPQDLGRVVLNMVSNACYATDNKRLSADQDYVPTLRIQTRNAGDRYEVSIRDNGGGIPSEVLEKIFNPFFTTKPTDQGTGLGLALSNDIVREHGGEIRVDTKPGDFTEMTLDLPKNAKVEENGDVTSADGSDAVGATSVGADFGQCCIRRPQGKPMRRSADGPVRPAPCTDAHRRTTMTRSPRWSVCAEAQGPSMCVSSDAATLVLDAYDGLTCGGVDRNDFVESADREHFADRIRERADCESGIAPLQILGRHEHSSKPCAADVGHRREINDHSAVAVSDQVFQAVLEIAGVAAVYAIAGGDDQNVICPS